MPRIRVAIPFKFTHPADGAVDYEVGEHEVDDFTAEHSFTKAHLAGAPPPAPVPGSTAYSVAENARKARLLAVQALSDDELEEALKNRPFVRQEPVIPGKFAEQAEHVSLAPMPVVASAPEHNDQDDDDGEDDGEDGEEEEDEAAPTDATEQPKPKRRRRRRRG